MSDMSDLASRYAQELTQKTEKLQAMLAPFNTPSLSVYPSQPQHYRMRAEFRIWHEGDDLFHIMFDQASKQRYRVDNFPTASLLINQMMQALLPLLKVSPVLRNRLFQIDYLSTQSGKIIVSLLYHKTLTEEWENAARQLRSQLQVQGFDLQLIGRASKQKVCLDHDYIDETLTVNGKSFISRQVENSFTQPNAGINEQMLSWTLDCTKNSQDDDLLELYCGNGNFSVVLAQNFRQVLATEIAKPSVEAAQFNIQANHIDNLQIIRMSAEDFTLAMQGVRAFYRLRNVDLSSYHCRTILVDPPRAGLDPATIKLVQNYDRILYISCNPNTLVENLSELCTTHRIEKAALFDQFPFTSHLETGVWLIRK